MTRAYKGSCHCGAIQYQLRLTLPPVLNDPNEYWARPTPTVLIYKCNCSTCHKMGIFHVRPIDPPADFVVLSPLSPDTELGAYKCFAENSTFYHCKNCGVRCFTYGGPPGVNEEVDLGQWRGEEPERKMTKIWMPKEGEWKKVVNGKEVVDPGCYLSINGVTIEPGQDGFDMKEFNEKGWIAYCDSRERKHPVRYGEPHKWGTY